jgi:hypothetical protein
VADDNGIIERTKEFDAKADDFAWGGRQTRARVRWLGVLLSITTALLILAGAQALYAAHTARVARESELSTYQSCINRNVQDIDQIGLWRYVIQLSGNTKLSHLQHYIDSIFVQRECVESSPAPTIAYLYHHVASKEVVVGSPIIITDEKCVPAAVHVFSSIVWEMVYPRTLLLPELTKSEQLPKGCGLHNHIDQMPADVIAEAQKLSNVGVTYSVWRVVGTETPSPSNMNVVTWKTPKFKIVP